MKWFILLVGVVVLCFAVALVLGLVGGQGGLGGASSSLSHERLPEGELHDADLDDLVFDVGLRGYRMSQVDGVVDRLRRELREKDEQVAVLRGERSVASGVTSGAAPGVGPVVGPAEEPAGEERAPAPDDANA